MKLKNTCHADWVFIPDSRGGDTFKEASSVRSYLLEQIQSLHKIESDKGKMWKHDALSFFCPLNYNFSILPTIASHKWIIMMKYSPTEHSLINRDTKKYDSKEMGTAGKEATDSPSRNGKIKTQEI